MFFAVILGLVIGANIHCQPTAAEGNWSEPSDKNKQFTAKPLIFAWIEKPPYVTPPSNGSLDNEAQGMIRDALLRHITVECGYHTKNEYKLGTWKVGSEFGMIELLRQNKAHVAVPIFEQPTNRRYSELPFFKLGDYPGTEYLTIEGKQSALSVVLEAVLKSWPLLAVTLVLTAIAGVIMWALVSTGLGIQNFLLEGQNFAVYIPAPKHH